MQHHIFISQTLTNQFKYRNGIDIDQFAMHGRERKVVKTPTGARGNGDRGINATALNQCHALGISPSPGHSLSHLYVTPFIQISDVDKSNSMAKIKELIEGA